MNDKQEQYLIERLGGVISMKPGKNMVASWETSDNKHWVELYSSEKGYDYMSDNSGGGMKAKTEKDAIKEIERLINMGLFDPRDEGLTFKRKK